MKTVIIGFSRPKKWKPFAWAIMLFDNSDISHAYTRFDSYRWDSSFIYQNAGTQTHFLGGKRFKEINRVVREYEIEVPDHVEAEVGSFCVQREGTSYGVMQVIGKGLCILVEVLSLGKIKIKNPFKSKTDCIEETAIILAQGLRVDVPLDMDTVSVKPFENFVAKLPNVKIRGVF